MSPTSPRLTSVFNYLTVEEINDAGVFRMARKLNICFGCGPGDFYVKSHWSQFPEYEVFAVEPEGGGEPERIFHIKRMWERGRFLEILGLHLASQVLDPGLTPGNYLFGQYTSGRWFWKRSAYYLLTTWVPGTPLPKDFPKKNALATPEATGEVWYHLGRQYAMHRFLSLYDVEPRHFFHAPGRADPVRRIDYGRAFDHLDYTRYNPEKNFLRAKHFAPAHAEEFTRGRADERERLARNLAATRSELVQAFEVVASLKRDNELVDFFPREFLRDVHGYWAREVDFVDAAGWIEHLLDARK